VRTLSRVLAAAALAAPLLVAFGAPASASEVVPPFDCPNAEPVCLYLSGSFPVSNPVIVAPIGTTMTYVPGPRYCDTATGKCIATFVGVPGAMLSSSGNTLGTLNVPGLGVGVSATGQVTVYGAAPTFTPSGSGLGIVASVTVPDFPVVVAMDGLGYECGSPSSTSLGPVTLAHVGCATVLTVSV
jgi:hypothetical protein